jgi:hypothetical protein
MPHPDAFGARVIRDRQPINETEGCGDQTTNDSGNDHPVRDARPPSVTRNQVDHIKDDGRG